MRLSKRDGFELVRGLMYLVETEFSQYLRKELGAEGDRVASYYSPITGKYCIGVWVDRDRGTVIELLSRGRGDPFSRVDAQFMRHYVSPARPRQIAAAKQKHLDRMTARRRERSDALRANEDRKWWQTQQTNIHYRPKRLDHKE